MRDNPYGHNRGDGSGNSRDLSLASVFLLTLLLMTTVVGILTVGSAWHVPDPSEIFPMATRSGGLFGGAVLEAEPAQPAAVEAAAPEATPTPEALAPTATAAPPTATPTVSPTPLPPKAYLVGNTGGVGVWLRRTPRLNDYLIAWPDRSRMVVVGDDVQAEGRLWRHVQDPRGNRGYIPAEWLIPAD